MQKGNKTTIAIVDDHEIMRNGLKDLLASHNFDVICSANNADTLLSAMELNCPHLLITDIHMPKIDGLDLLFTVNKRYPQLKKIILSYNYTEKIFLKAIQANINGYMLKSAGSDEILAGINQVIAGITYYSTEIQPRINSIFAKYNYDPRQIIHILDLFNEKELKVIKLICEDKSSKEIADTLFMSSRTVEGYRLKILEKMDVKTTAGIVKYALVNNIIFHE